MIGLPDNLRIYLCTEPVDFRKGFDGLTGVVTARLGRNVTDGSLFLFVNRKRDRVKALWWETQEKPDRKNQTPYFAGAAAQYRQFISR